MATVRIDPQTRIEGHLAIKAEVDGGTISSAKSSGVLFRGFEIILKDHEPRDATVLTQRICGVCPVSHGMASAKCLDSALGVTPTENGRIMRNLVLGANFIMSHILHLYHLAALDYVRGPEMPPWTPRYEVDYRFDEETNATLVGHYVQALAIRRKAQEMGAIFGGRLPCPPAYVPGGFTETPTAEQIDRFRAYLDEIRPFIDEVYIPDVLAVASTYSDYFGIGKGCGNLLAYGVFDLDATGESKLLPRGRYTEGALQDVDPQAITEHVQYSWYSSPSGLNPANGETEPAPGKTGAYSWLKSPRYEGKVHEVGPLARIFIAYQKGVPAVVDLVDYVLNYFGAEPAALFSVLGREAARAIECKYIADSMGTWLDQLQVGEPVYVHAQTPSFSSGIGLTEAPRGALGHWMEISNYKISRYQVITPTNWNASPRDDEDQPGPIEQALVGTPISDYEQPVEAVRVVHSFDPCIACAVHLITPQGDVRKFAL